MTPEKLALLRSLCDGKRHSGEIAPLLGVGPRYVRKLVARLGLPSPPPGARPGAENPQFETGRRIATSGYALVSVPIGYPGAKMRPGRQTGSMWEHRLVLERKLGRSLLPSETVDHIDGLTLHNAPENLRLFEKNSDHLRETLTGKVPRWTDEGYANMKLRHVPGAELQRVDIYRQRRANGELRLRQILLLALSLGPDSPYLLGTTRHTTKAGIDMSCRSTIERALADLYRKWGWAQTP